MPADSRPLVVPLSHIRPTDTTAPIQQARTSGDMYPNVTKEMPSAPPFDIETVTNTRQQAQPPSQPSVITLETIPPLGPRSVQLICPTCRRGVQSSVEETSSTHAYYCCTILFIIGCCLFSCLPFCMDTFKVYKHSCPNCKAYIGTYQQS